MMHLTLRFMIAGAAFPVLAAAQVPPVSPKPPTMPAPVAQPPVRVVPLPVEPLPPIEPLLPPVHWDFPEHSKVGLMELAHQAELMKFEAQELRFHAQELAHMDLERVKVQAEQLKFRMQDFVAPDVEHLRLQVEDMKHYALMDFPRVPEAFAPGASRDKLLNGRPRASWAREDPADSLYRLARESLNRGEYRRAAQLFNEVTKKYPKSVYALDCAYWEAFSRYRAGTTDDLRQALKILDEGRERFAQLRRDESNVDVQGLRARVQGALAARGDNEAAKSLREEAAQSSGCDREEISVRAEALSALGQMDLAAALPAVKKVLARRDECTVELRRRALYLLGRQPSAESVPIMLDVAKNDTDANIRGEAMSWLSRVAGDQAVPLLEDLLKNSTDERTQRSAVSALGSIDTERARRAVRTIIERNDAVERVRYDAIVSLSRDRENRTQSAEEMTYLRSLYGKVESPRLKEAVLTSVSRVPTPENEKFLLDVARNQNESASLRAGALQRLGRMTTVNVNDIAKLYDVADSRSLREQILYALSQRKEPEAIDKMIEIAKKDTDPQIRRTAISMLGRSNNERAKQFLQDFWDKPE